MKPADLTDSQRARLDQAFALVRENSEKRIQEAAEILTNPRRSVALGLRLQRLLRTTDTDLFNELSASLLDVSMAEGNVWNVMIDALAMLNECNNYRDGGEVHLFDPFTEDDDDDEDC